MASGRSKVERARPGEHSGFSAGRAASGQDGVRAEFSHAESGHSQSPSDQSSFRPHQTHVQSTASLHQRIRVTPKNSDIDKLLQSDISSSSQRVFYQLVCHVNTIQPRVNSYMWGGIVFFFQKEENAHSGGGEEGRRDESPNLI